MSSRHVRGIAVWVCLAFALQACSAAIAQMDRVGPDPDREFAVGTARADVEKALGKPIATQTMDDGRVRAVYEYTARVGKRGGPNLDGPVFWIDVFTLGGAELIFTPMAYFGKEKRTFRKEFTYGVDDRVTASSPENATSPPRSQPAR